MSKRKPRRNPGTPSSQASAARAVEHPKQRTQARSRRGLMGLITPVFLVAVAAVAGLLLARNTATKGFSIGGQQIALPSESPGDSEASGKRLGLAPGFSIRTLSGGTFSLKPQAGPVVLSFIAGWCASCLGEAEAGGQLVRDFGKQGVRVLAVDADPSDSIGQLRQFIAAAGNPPIEFAMDRTSEVTTAYRVRALDTTVIIDRNGRMVYRDEWPSDYGTLASVVKRLVNAQAAAPRATSAPATAGG